jgi:predicted RNA-binding Zn-ribbon protein involved in translation (DUF1610 family)
MQSSDKPIQADNKIAKSRCPKCGRDTKLVIAMPDVTTPGQELRTFKCLSCGFEHVLNKATPERLSIL